MEKHTEFVWLGEIGVTLVYTPSRGLIDVITTKNTRYSFSSRDLGDVNFKKFLETPSAGIRRGGQHKASRPDRVGAAENGISETGSAVNDSSEGAPAGLAVDGSSFIDGMEKRHDGAGHSRDGMPDNESRGPQFDAGDDPASAADSDVRVGGSNEGFECECGRHVPVGHGGVSPEGADSVPGERMPKSPISVQVSGMEALNGSEVVDLFRTIARAVDGKNVGGAL